MADSSGTYDLTGLLFPITRGAATDQNATGPVVYNLIGVADTFNLSSAAGSTVLVTQAVSAVDTVNLTTNGGAIQVGAGLVQALDTMSLDLTGGGSVSLAATAGVTGAAFLSLLNAGSIAYGAGGGTLDIGTAGAFSAMSETAAITGFKTGTDQIDEQSLSFANLTGYTVTGAANGTQTVTISDTSGSFSFKTSNAGLADGAYTSLTSGPITLSSDGAGGAVIGAVCFLAGTRLATPSGETRVEALAVGDLVTTREAGRDVHRPVVWIGRRAVDPARAGAGAVPVRIRAHAFADDTPHRDLLVTQEHCVHVDGRLIPARMLVNGASVTLDASVGAYEFFHVELDRHAILVSDGLETESYLDTGNRANFANAAVPALKPGFAVDPSAAAWAERAAAPLAVDRATVEPVWARLAERARASGAAAPAAPPLTCEPDLRVVTDAGVEIRPSLADGRSYAFVIPGGARSLRLVSRAARPSETVGPFVDDRRSLGVLVGKVGLGVGRRRATAEAAAFGDLPGWHAAEPGAPGRWTDGDALLPLDAWAWGEAPAFLDVEVINAGPYHLPREALAA